MCVIVSVMDLLFVDSQLTNGNRCEEEVLFCMSMWAAQSHTFSRPAGAGTHVYVL